MFYDIFKGIENNLRKKRSLTTSNIPTINPSSQVCYSDIDGKQVGTCLRQGWFDKTEQKKTNPLGLKVMMAGFAGDWWEDWFISQTKQLGIYEDENISACVPSRMVKGLIDVSISNPNNNGKVELVEVKTYDGGNYYAAQQIIGTTKVHPRPKDNHLLQAFRYLLVYKDKVDAINITYIDRSCSAWFKNKQFRVTILQIGGKSFPRVEMIWNDALYSYTESRVTLEGIIKAEDALIQNLINNTVPNKEYEISYSNDKIIRLYDEGKIYKTTYEKYVKNPMENPIGDWQCRTCPYSYGTCENFDD